MVEQGGVLVSPGGWVVWGGLRIGGDRKKRERVGGGRVLLEGGSSGERPRRGRDGGVGLGGRVQWGRLEGSPRSLPGQGSFPS